MNQKYETAGIVQRTATRVLMPIVSHPKIGKFLFVKLSRMGRSIQRLASEYKCLEIIYGYSREQTKGRGLIERILTHLLLSFLNAKAVRNRLRLVERIIEDIIQKTGRVEIISLAAGSGRDIIDVFSQNPDGNTAVLIDRSRQAINYSKNLAQTKGVADNLTWARGMVEEFVKNGKKMKPNLALMVGFLDYPNDEEAIEIFKEIYRILQPGGYFITSNITNNPERTFLHTILKWPTMHYRSHHELKKILEAGGFNNPLITAEPTDTHLVAIAQKLYDP